MEEIVMESESAETVESAPHLGVGDAWETVTAALVSRLLPRNF